METSQKNTNCESNNQPWLRNQPRIVPTWLPLIIIIGAILGFAFRYRWRTTRRVRRIKFLSRKLSSHINAKYHIECHYVTGRLQPRGTIRNMHIRHWASMRSAYKMYYESCVNGRASAIIQVRFEIIRVLYSKHTPIVLSKLIAGFIH